MQVARVAGDVRARRRSRGLVAWLCLALAACAAPGPFVDGAEGEGTSADDARPSAPTTTDAPAPPREPLDPGRVASPALTALEEAQGTSSTVVVAKLNGRRLVFAADVDDPSVVTFDPSSRREVARRRLRVAPAQMVVGADGLLYVALRDANAVAVFEADPRRDGALVAREEIPTMSEPVALATRDDALLVVSGWGHTLESFSLARRRRELAVELAREPRAVTFARDGATAFVSHMVGARVTTVDLGDAAARSQTLRGGDRVEVTKCDPDGKVRTFIQETSRAPLQGFSVVTFEDRVLLPGVLVRTGDPSVRTNGYGVPVADLPSEIFSVSVTDAAGTKASAPSLHVQMEAVAQRVGRFKPCLLPRGAAVDEERGSLFVACLDSGLVLELDARAADPARAEKRRFLVSPGPSGVAVDVEEREAYAFSSFTGAMDVLVLGGPHATPADKGGYYRSVRVKLRSTEDEDRSVVSRAVGRGLFHQSGDRRISRDGRACASCHPDGRDDGLVWPTPNGPRQAPMLAGRLVGTAPYSWSNEHPLLEDHLAQTISRLGGTGLDMLETAALVDYLTSMPGPRRRVEPTLAARIERGHELFEDPSVGCAECHREGSSFTDGAMHDVASRRMGDTTASFDTPSLRFVGGTAPYFHDGRYATLRDLLRETDGSMGSTGRLDEPDVAALTAYLESL